MLEPIDPSLDMAASLRALHPSGYRANGEGRFTVFVLNWETLLTGFELTNECLLRHLRLRRAELGGTTKDELVQSLSEGVDDNLVETTQHA